MKLFCNIYALTLKMDSAQAIVITAEMGFGHQRAVEPFAHLAYGGIVDIGKDPAVSSVEKKIWKRLLTMYSLLSRVRRIPVVGRWLFGVIDFFLKIPPLYPVKKRALPSIQVRILDLFVRFGLCRGIIEKVRDCNLPLLTSFYAPAIAADRAGFEPVYCIVCDADISRAWVAPDPFKSGINYCVPCGRAFKRLKLYGVPEERIHLTGFPLPEELVGTNDMALLKMVLIKRLIRLDPDRKFISLNEAARSHPN